MLRVEANGSVRFEGLPAGDHMVELGDVATNCTVVGENSHGITLTENSITETSFNLLCAPDLPRGDLNVTANTTGEELDPDGYTVTVDGQMLRVEVNGSVLFEGLPAGDYMVELGDVAANCTVAGSNPRTVTVSEGGVSETAFAVDCVVVPPPGLVGPDWRMTGGLSIGNVNIAAGLVLHCEAGRRSSLHVTWGENRWQLSGSLTSAQCTDDPSVDPGPPSPHFDTFTGEAVGRLNGEEGSVIRFTFIDGGEPGSGADHVVIYVWAPGADTRADAPVLGLDAPVDRGNLQAHPR
jgi:hypothetical protein